MLKTLFQCTQNLAENNTNNQEKLNMEKREGLITCYMLKLILNEAVSNKIFSFLTETCLHEFSMKE